MSVFQLKPGCELWLASGSPRRRELLASLGLSPRIIRPISAEPEPLPGEPPDRYARRAACAKANWAQKEVGSREAVIIAADTVVCANDRPLGKPATEPEALLMLETLNAAWHCVYTAVTIAPAARAPIIFCERTDVHFADWPEDVLRAYLRTGDSMDKAGAYGIQEQGAFLVDRLRGSWSNIVGLPLAPLLKILMELEIVGPALS